MARKGHSGKSATNGADYLTPAEVIASFPELSGMSTCNFSRWARKGCPALGREPIRRKSGKRNWFVYHRGDLERALEAPAVLRRNVDVERYCRAKGIAVGTYYRLREAAIWMGSQHLTREETCRLSGDNANVLGTLIGRHREVWEEIWQRLWGKSPPRFGQMMLGRTRQKFSLAALLRLFDVPWTQIAALVGMTPSNVFQFPKKYPEEWKADQEKWEKLIALPNPEAKPDEDGNYERKIDHWQFRPGSLLKRKRPDRHDSPEERGLPTFGWLHHFTAVRPKDYKHGPLIGTKVELGTWLGGKGGTCHRKVKRLAKDGTIWVKKESRQRYWLWFKMEGLYLLAKNRVPEELRTRALHSDPL